MCIRDSLTAWPQLRQHPRQVYALALTARQGQVAAPGQMCSIGCLQRLLHDLRIAHASAVMRQPAHGDHLFDTEGEIQARTLRQDGQTPGALRPGPGIERTLIQRHLPCLLYTSRCV